MITELEQLYQALRGHVPKLGDWDRFQEICNTIQNQENIKIKRLHQDSIGAWFYGCVFRELGSYEKEPSYHFILFQKPFIAFGRLSQEQYQNFETSSNYVTEITYENQNHLRPYFDSEYTILDADLMNMNISKAMEEKMIALQLMDPYLFTWKPVIVGNLIFNWWDD